MTTKAAIVGLRQWLDAWAKFGTPKPHAVSVRAGKGDVTLDMLRTVLAAAERAEELEADRNGAADALRRLVGSKKAKKGGGR